MIAIIDYGMGNLSSVFKALKKLGAEAAITDKVSKISKAESVILPGVGNFGDGMKNLQSSGMVDAVKESIAGGKPFLGICLGMQLLMEKSEEAPGVEGLGIFKGKVVRFKKSSLKVPHMGWNDITIKRGNPNLKGIKDGTFFYFVHSFYVKPADSEISAATCSYGVEFAACLGKDNVFATQFHPEKSQDAGLQILKNWISQEGGSRP
ncbi:MAG TPA: imidazole glycerol phosphate synthase subunit HisH [Lentisphaeria bacterium]|nr:MAG: imidazole glycerol phosphate synthase, glutamine amidotransferase subunit [Lentisphaerae bacterium GWF2_50_93]HCE43108.1 imidazole glycerol phosphate synthase subunit HisH [Lentisphaeria bacterium]